MLRYPCLEGNGGVATPARPITDRQLEILKNVARGRTNRQIGEILGISEKTVRNHLRTISHKLSTSDRTHAVVLAIGNGWIAIPIEPDGEPMPAAEAAPEEVTTIAPGSPEAVPST
jgi:DNA-binding CsgD family transcriptional regulator